MRYPGFGAIVAIVLAEGEMAADLLSHTTRLWVHATSLGGVESTPRAPPPLEGRGRHHPRGAGPAVVGIEDVEDLWEDLRAALDGCVG